MLGVNAWALCVLVHVTGSPQLSLNASTLDFEFNFGRRIDIYMCDITLAYVLLRLNDELMQSKVTGPNRILFAFWLPRGAARFIVHGQLMNHNILSPPAMSTSSATPDFDSTSVQSFEAYTGWTTIDPIVAALPHLQVRDSNQRWQPRRY